MTATVTTCEELAGLVVQLSAPQQDVSEDWIEARDAFISMHDHYTAAVAAGAHPAMVLYCAHLLESRASEFESTIGDNAGSLSTLCCCVLESTESVVSDAEHRLWAHEDGELPTPPATAQRPDASFEEAAAWNMDPSDELDAIAELVAQDAVAADRGSVWRGWRDRFLKYYSGLGVDGLNPAIAHYYIKQMSRCLRGMHVYYYTPGPVCAFHDRAQKLLWKLEDNAEYEMYCHDASSCAFAYPQPEPLADPSPAT